MSGGISDFGVYVHIPFCVAKCRYCDFNSCGGRLDELPRYLAALTLAMIASASDAADRRARTLYLGGGTPSLLRPSQIKGIVDDARRLFRLDADAEVTLEANPGTVDAAYLAALRGAGVNRLSLGVQSLDEEVLSWLGRIHDAAAARAAVAAARRAGFENLSLDLIYALPGQTPDSWRQQLLAAAALSPEHLSLYALSIEEETPLGAELAAGRLRPLGEDEAAALADVSAEVLPQLGYEQYEVSNWARTSPSGTDWRSRHNLGYWRHEEYLGFGAGAHSYWGNRRFSQLVDPAVYATAIEAGDSTTVDVEVIEPLRAAQDALMLGLRLTEGIDLPTFRTRFGADLEAGRNELAELAELGLLSRSVDRLAATARGRLVLHEVLLRLLPSLRLV